MSWAHLDEAAKARVKATMFSWSLPVALCAHHYWLEEWWARKEKEFQNDATMNNDPDDDYPVEGLEDREDDFLLHRDIVADMLEVDELRAQASERDKMYQLVYFKVAPRGTDCTWAAKHVASDGMRGEACHPDSINFCLLYLPQRSISYDTVNTFSVSDAEALARVWCMRAQHFFTIWKDGGCDKNFRFTAEMLATFEEPLAFREIADSLPNDRVTQTRLRQARGVVPKLGEPDLKKYYAYHAGKRGTA